MAGTCSCLGVLSVESTAKRVIKSRTYRQKYELSMQREIALRVYVCFQGIRAKMVEFLCTKELHLVCILSSMLCAFVCLFYFISFVCSFFRHFLIIFTTQPICNCLSLSTFNIIKFFVSGGFPCSLWSFKVEEGAWKCDNGDHNSNRNHQSSTKKIY